MHIGISGPIFIPSIVAHIHQDISTWPKGMGGAPVNHLINALLEQGEKLSIVSLSPELKQGEVFKYSQPNLNIFIGPFRVKGYSKCKDLFLKERKFITNAFKELNPEIIHAHWQYEWSWGALESNIPTLVTCHDSPLHILKVSPGYYRLTRLLMAKIVLNKARYLTTVSPYVAEALKPLTKKRIDIIPNSEPDFVFNFYKKRTIAKAKPVKVAMINSGFKGLKNVITGIKAFEIFSNQYAANCELHLFGPQHGAKEEASKWCKKNNINANIIFHGEKPFEELMNALNEMTVLLHTSKEESFGMVLIEAMAMGIPVVAGKAVGAIPWILEEGGGLLTDITQPEDVATGLKKICEIDVYSTLSEEAYNNVSNRFRKSKVIISYQNLYKKIIENAGVTYS